MRFKKNIIMMVASLSILSCGTMNNPDNLQEVPSEVSSLAKSLRVYEKSLPTLPQASHTIPIESETKSCTDGGTIGFTNDYNQTQIEQNPNNFTLNLTSKAINCLEEGTLVNGTIEINIMFLNDTQTTTSTFITDFTIINDIEQVLVKKGSFSIIESIDDDTDISTSTTNIITINSTQQTIALKTKEFNKNETTSITNISGKKIIDGKTFIVDESFDHASTPMVYDRDENLQVGGKQRFKNDENHIILMEAVGINKIKISVDEDGDGKADTVETLVTL